LQSVQAAEPQEVRLQLRTVLMFHRAVAPGC
jgi:hypothetical protein